MSSGMEVRINPKFAVTTKTRIERNSYNGGRGSHDNCLRVDIPYTGNISSYFL